MMRASPNPFQKMQEEREEDSGAFFAEIEAYMKKHKPNSYAYSRHGGLVAAHKVERSQAAFGR